MLSVTRDLASPTALILLAANPLPLALSAGLHALRRCRKFRRQFRECGAGCIFWAKPVQRHRKLQETVGRFATLPVVLIPLEERSSSSLVLTAHEIGFSKPVLRVSGERVARIFAQEIVEGRFRRTVVS